LAASSAAGANNLKVAGMTDFIIGQSIVIDTGANQEIVVVANVGTPGASALKDAIASGVTVIQLAIPAMFTPGQTITIDNGENQETAVVVSSTGSGRGQPLAVSITVASPLAKPHAAGIQIAGTGITIMGGLTKPHESGAQVASSIPTPGAPNQYRRHH